MLELWKVAYGKNRILIDYDDPPGNPSAKFLIDPVGWAKKRPTDLPDSIQVVHGHFRPCKYDLVKNVFRMTMLRHPVDNLISIYCYWKKIPIQPNAVHRYFLENNLDILSLARLPIMQNLYCVTYFGGWDIRRLDFIGRHENRSDDLSRLRKILGVSMNNEIHLNSTEPNGIDKEREAIMSNKRVKGCLTDLLIKDIKFYDKYAGRI